MGRRVTAILIVIILIMSQVGSIDMYADSIGEEAGVCKELGILIGADSSGVSPAYLATTPTRIQAFIISLRLKGLYGEATGYVGSDNFKDAASSSWAASYMAYAKSRPELGWGGMPDGTFAPGDPINAQQFYKVMLETLGYKQGLEFKYQDTLNFSQKIGLIKSAVEVAGIKNFTINDVAKAIYRTLNTKTQDSDKKLIDVLVENNSISADKAIAAGFNLTAEEVKIVEFINKANNKLEFELDKELQVQKSDIEITEEGGNSRLSVLSVVNQGRRVSVITTEAKPFKAYEVAVNTLVPVNGMAVKGYKSKYVGMPRDYVKPTLKHEVLSSSEILITFSEEMDKESVETLSNYYIERNVTVLNAQLNEAGNAVVLNTTELSSNDFYKLTVQRVTDIAGNSIDAYTSHFDGPFRDIQAPNALTVQSGNNRTVIVTFNERVERSSAENTSNYSIDNGVSINSAKLEDDGKSVVLSTSSQDSGIIYNLVIQNILDVSGNPMFKKEFRFVGDSTRPTASVLAISNNEVRITFNEKVDEASAERIDNYSIDKGLEIKSAVLDGSGKVVSLITSDQTPSELYTVMISGVTDLWGNTVNTYINKFAGVRQSTSDLSYTATSSGNTIVVKFNKRVDERSAEDVFNYALDEELGYAAKATLDTEATGSIVTLLTDSQANGKMYSITVKNVKDISGNVISSDERISTKRFIGFGVSGDTVTGTLNLEAVAVVDVNTIDLIFSSDLTAAELESMRIAIEIPGGSSYSLPSGMEYSKYFMNVSGKKVVRVQFRTSTSNNPELFRSGSIYDAKITGIERLYIKDNANVKAFAGTGILNEAPRLISTAALNSTAVEVQFSEPVKGLTKYLFSINNNITINSVSVGSDYITDKVVLYLSSSTQLKDDITYKLQIKSGIKDAAGIGVVFDNKASYCEFAGNSSENEAPIVSSDITLIDNCTLQLGFSEPVKNITNSSFSVRRIAGTGNSQFIPAKTVLSEDETVVTIYYNSRYGTFIEGNEFELTISSSVTDKQGLAVDSAYRKLQFVGTGISPGSLEIIASSVSEDNKQISLYTNRTLNIIDLRIEHFEITGADYYKSSFDSVEYNDRMIRITLRNALKSNDTVNVKITESGRSQIRDYNNQMLYNEELRINTR